MHKNVFDKGSHTGINPDAPETNRPLDKNIFLDRLKAKDIIGYDIRNPEGKDLGKVDNLMVNLRTGEVEYVVVEFGAFLGVGGKLFAIPFKELRPDDEHKRFILDRDKEYLKNSPGFDKMHWPDTNDHSYFDNVSLYYGTYLPPFP